MAVQKLNTSKVTAKDALTAKETLSAKNTITAKDALTAKDTLSAKDALTVKGNISAKESIVAADSKKLNVEASIRSLEKGGFDKVADEPVISFINSFKLNKRSFVNVNVKTDVMSWRIADGAIGFSKDEIVEKLRNLGERVSRVEMKDKAKADLAIRGFKLFFKSFLGNGVGIKAEVDPDGSINVTYLGSATLSPSSVSPSIKYLSYELKRKEKNGSVWILVDSGESNILKTIKDKKSLTLNTEYTYCLKVTDTKTNETTEHSADIFYNPLNVEVVDFVATPDPIKKRINFSCNVKNYTKLKIVRNDTGKVFEYDEYDYDVKLGKKYKYTLFAENCWQRDVTKDSVVECSNSLLPRSDYISAYASSSQKKVCLEWLVVFNAGEELIYRREKGLSWGNPIHSQTPAKRTGATGRDSYGDEDPALKRDTEYGYKILWKNEWGETTSSEIEIKTGTIPERPRLLPPSAELPVRWTCSDNVESYEIKRYDESGDEETFYKIDSDLIEPNQKWIEEGGLFAKKYVKDNAIKNNVRYLYKIIAKNGWGDSSPCYSDVKRNDNSKGKNDESCYEFIDRVWLQSYKVINCVNVSIKPWIINCQGFTTDGYYWYIANGVPEHDVLNPPTLRKVRVDSTLDKAISSSYDFPDAEHVHVGDIDCYGDYLFAAVYKTDRDNTIDSKNERYFGEIWILNKNTMKRITTTKLFYWNANGSNTPIHNTAWCAVNPRDGRLYTSTSYFYDGVIYSFKIEIENIRRIEKGEKDLEVLSSCRKVYLVDEYGKPFVKESMQGGCFDYYNNLYLNSGFKDPNKQNQGIQVFKLVRDEEQEIKELVGNVRGDVAVSQIYEGYKSGDADIPCVFNKGVLLARSHQQDGGFKYQFDVEKDHEPEGLVYHDFSCMSLVPPDGRIKEGSFHATLLCNAEVGLDSLSFRSYKHLHRETELKSVFYMPSNLEIVFDEGKKDFKIVDRGILVKRFSTLSFAQNAMNVLKNFKTIYTIGWLNTSSNEHNYEFSVLKCGNKTLSHYANYVIQYDPNQIQESFVSERHLVYFVGKNNVKYHFCAHNKEDAEKIKNELKKYKKICIIGVGADLGNCDYLSGINFGRRIRSAYNLIWLEK